MQVVAIIESRFEDFRIRRITGDGIVVDNDIERTAGPDPAIDGLPNFFALLAVVSGAFVRCQRAADHLDAVRMRPLDQLL